MAIIQHDITMDELMPIISCNYQIFSILQNYSLIYRSTEFLMVNTY